MPITVSAGGLRPTTDTRPLPGAMKTALTAPGPVSVASTGTVAGGSAALEATVAANRSAYWGYSLKTTSGVNEQPSLGNGAVVEGFAGVTQGGLVYVADDGTLTHTAPTTVLTDSGTDTVAVPLQPIGIGVRTTAIYFFAR
jgi:hypothetical protein